MLIGSIDHITHIRLFAGQKETNHCLFYICAAQIFHTRDTTVSHSLAQYCFTFLSHSCTKMLERFIQHSSQCDLFKDQLHVRAISSIYFWYYTFKLYMELPASPPSTTLDNTLTPIFDLCHLRHCKRRTFTGQRDAKQLFLPQIINKSQLTATLRSPPALVSPHLLVNLCFTILVLLMFSA